MKLLNLLLASGLVFSLGACNADSTQNTSAKETSAMTANLTELQKIDTQVGTCLLYTSRCV